jgi:hypothetical protein
MASSFSFSQDSDPHHRTSCFGDCAYDLMVNSFSKNGYIQLRLFCRFVSMSKDESFTLILDPILIIKLVDLFFGPFETHLYRTLR